MIKIQGAVAMPGLMRQINAGTVMVGEEVNSAGHLDWLKDSGTTIIGWR